MQHVLKKNWVKFLNFNFSFILSRTQLLTDKLSCLKKRVIRKYYPFFVLSISIFITFPSFAVDVLNSDIQEIQNIAQSGAVSLALQSIDEKQQELDIKK